MMFTFNSGPPESPTLSRAVQIRLMVLFPRKGLTSTDVATYMSGFVLNGRPDPAHIVVMYDRTFTIGASNPAVASGNEPRDRLMRFYKKTKFQFNYNNATQIDREPMIYFFSNFLTGDTSNAVINGFTSMSFKDM